MKNTKWIIFIKLIIFLLKGDAYGLVVTRILIGILHGPLHPCLSKLAVIWFPIEQRGQFNSIVFVGNAVSKKPIKTLIFFSQFLIGNKCKWTLYDFWSKN